MNPKVSVIMSVYNGARYLNQAIDSILGQTFTNFEFIIVDDCSSDLSFKIISDYAQIDSRVRLIKNEQNLGLTKSLNKAIELATGEYIVRIDADDICHPERLTKQIEYLNTNPQVGLVGSWATIINEKGDVCGELKYPTENGVIRRELIKYNPFIHSSIMVRKNILDQVGGYDPDWQYAQDYELYFRLSGLCEMVNLSETLVSSRVSDRSITMSKNRRQTLFAIKARINAIRSGLYSFYCYIYLIRPILGMIIGPNFKKKIKNLFLKS